MKILITGSSGMIGLALISALAAEGHTVGRLLRSRSSDRAPYWDIASQTLQLYDFKNADAVIHLAGENISEGRWTQAKKARIVDSRVDGTRFLAESLANLPNTPKVFIPDPQSGFMVTATKWRLMKRRHKEADSWRICAGGGKRPQRQPRRRGFG